MDICLVGDYYIRVPRNRETVRISIPFSIIRLAHECLNSCCLSSCGINKLFALRPFFLASEEYKGGGPPLEFQLLWLLFVNAA